MGLVDLGKEPRIDEPQGSWQALPMGKLIARTLFGRKQTVSGSARWLCTFALLPRGCEEGRPVTVRPLSVFLLSKRRDASISKTYSLLTKPPLGLYPVSCALSSGNSMARKRKFSLGQTNA